MNKTRIPEVIRAYQYYYTKQTVGPFRTEDDVKNIRDMYIIMRERAIERCLKNGLKLGTSPLGPISLESGVMSVMKKGGLHLIEVRLDRKGLIVECLSEDDSDQSLKPALESVSLSDKFHTQYGPVRYLSLSKLDFFNHNSYSIQNFIQKQKLVLAPQ